MTCCVANGWHDSHTQRGFPKHSCSLTTQQPETCPHPTEHLLSLPERCSLEGHGCHPGVWGHSEALLLGDAMPPAGHGETGPEHRKTRSTGILKWGRVLVGGREPSFPSVLSNSSGLQKGQQPQQAVQTKGLRGWVQDG